MSEPDFINQLQELALGTRLKRLSDTLMGDVAKIYKDEHLDFEPRWFTMLYLLNKEKTLSIIEISDRLKLTHPAVVQFANQLKSKKFVLEKKDKNDARKRMLAISTKGKLVVEKLQPILIQIENSTRDLLQESGVDLLYSIEKVEKSLHTQSMYNRVKLGLKKRMLSEVKITPFQSKYRADFKQLNESWIQKFFTPEKSDNQILGNPEKYILESGGEVFFAVHQKKAIGTIGISNHGKGIFEVNKMAVAEEFQGLSIGAKLLTEAIAFAKKKRAKQVYLESNTKLRAAIHLYDKLGFKEVKDFTSSTYKRTNIKMTYMFN
ncbi:MAG: MarR family transcriptional regulator/GNAT family N-acetyltransferase [Bacteroidetes bacterium]|nr:MarR family transcriptional regulator/GNAT family N-acetyltransferase [Bacteroidota bacterium]